jgi:DNA-binding XRE family transcriptional regulator
MRTNSLMSTNSLKEIRESFMISKTELARKANISSITLTRIELGKPSRMETKRKILLALGLNQSVLFKEVLDGKNQNKTGN